MKRPRRIFVVDDDPSYLQLFDRVLKMDGYQVECFGNGKLALEALTKQPPDLMLLDINMPELDGYGVLNSVRELPQHVAVIFMSSQDKVEDVVRGLDAGADDYVRKPVEPLEVLARVRAQLRLTAMYDKMNEANSKLYEMVETDDLTGLYNMRNAYRRLESEMERSRRYQRDLALVMMDIDNFKRVNDLNDHLFGSFVLSEFGKLVRQLVRKSDYPVRYGGDEFLILLVESSTEGAKQFAERFRQMVAGHLFKNEHSSMHLTVSLGVAMYGPKSAPISSQDFIRAADQALYHAKRQGKNCVVMTDL